MIPVTIFAGRNVAVLGLGVSGLAVARSLKAGGAKPVLWDDKEAARGEAGKQGFIVRDLSDADWSGFAALVLAPGIPLTHPAPHWSVLRARDAGIVTVIDGAHAIGQLSLDVAALGADFYTSNAHKWLCAPKGSAFLYAHKDVQPLIEPLVVSWGWGEERPFTFGSNFLDAFQWSGTMDYSAFLSVPAAIRFQDDHDWPIVRERCHVLARRTIGRISELTGCADVYRSDAAYAQMAIAQLPPVADLQGFKRRLYSEHRVEVPCVQWGDRQFIRISIQGYNTESDTDALLAALGAL